MNRVLRKTWATFLIVCLLLGTLQLSYASASSTKQFADGEYSIPFKILKDNTDESSVMYNYVDTNSGKLIVEDGKTYVSITLKQSKEITGFKTEYNGNLSDALTVSEDTTSNTRTIKFEVEDVTGPLNGWVKIDWPAVNYHHEYDVDLTFDTTNVPAPADPVDPVTPVDPVDPSNPEDPTDQENAINNGLYNLNFAVYKNGTSEVSSLEKYVKKPALLTVQNSVYNVSLTLKDSDLITTFQTEQNGTMKDANVTGFDATNNTRTVSFPIKDLSSQLNVYLEVVAQIPTGTYTGKYTVQFKFDPSALSPAEVEKPAYEASVISVQANEANTLQHGSALSVSVPAGAGGSNNFFMSATQLSNSEVSSLVGANDKLLSPVYELEKSFDGTFAKPVTLKLQYSASSVPSGYKAAVFYYDEVNKVWKHVGGTGVNGTIEASTDHFTKFAVLALADPTSNSGTGTGTDTGNGSSNGTGGSSDSLTNGTYTLNYNILKYGTSEASVMEQYIIKPGTLIVSGSKKYFQMTLKQSKEITGFKVKQGGSLTDATVVKSDSASNTRVVQFEVSDLSQKIDAWVKIDWAEVNYFHEYDVNISFGTPVLQSGSVDTTVSPTTEENKNNTTTESTKEETVPNKGTDNSTATKVNFSDIASHWAKASIEEAVSLGFVSGYNDGTFRPNAQITRAEFTVMLSKALQLDGNYTLNFTDAKNVPAWAKTYVGQAVQAGIISGYKDDTFRPSQNITRAELAVMIQRAAGTTPDANAQPSFKDNSSIPSWAIPSVAYAVNNGLMNGRGNNLFAPNANATRAEAVTLILNLLHSKE